MNVRVENQWMSAIVVVLEKEEARAIAKFIGKRAKPAVVRDFGERLRAAAPVQNKRIERVA